MKVLDALAWGLPVVTTTAGVEGIQLAEGDGRRRRRRRTTSRRWSRYCATRSAASSMAKAGRADVLAQPHTRASSQSPPRPDREPLARRTCKKRRVWGPKDVESCKFGDRRQPNIGAKRYFTGPRSAFGMRRRRNGSGAMNPIATPNAAPEAGAVRQNDACALIGGPVAWVVEECEVRRLLQGRGQLPVGTAASVPRSERRCASCRHLRRHSRQDR